MAKFTWGIVLERYRYDFDGQIMEVIKFNPWKQDGVRILTGQPDEYSIRYHCDEINESSDSLQYLLLSWIAHKNLGQNQYPLVIGISKALGIYKVEND